MREQDGKRVVVVTGASAGVGKETARRFVELGWKVFGVGRSAERCAAADAEINTFPGADFTMLRTDLSRLPDVARLGDHIVSETGRLDILVNNAGGVTADRVLTPEGHETTFAANHLGPFLLTQKLAPLLSATAAASAPGAVRVLTVSSTGHEQCPGVRWDDLTFTDGFVGGAAYCHAKLANILFARELARRMAGDGVVSHAMHPGVVDSNFVTHCDPGMKAYIETILDTAYSPDEVAAMLVWMATAAAPGQRSGLYYHGEEDLTPTPSALDDTAAQRLWALSEELVAGY